MSARGRHLAQLVAVALFLTATVTAGRAGDPTSREPTRSSVALEQPQLTTGVQSARLRAPHEELRVPGTQLMGPATPWILLAGLGWLLLLWCFRPRSRHVMGRLGPARAPPRLRLL